MLLNSPNNVFNINDVENDVKSDVEKAKMILAEIRKNNKISQKSLSEKTRIPYATLQRLMNKLKKDEVIRRVGSAKGGYWEIM